MTDANADPKLVNPVRPNQQFENEFPQARTNLVANEPTWLSVDIRPTSGHRLG